MRIPAFVLLAAALWLAQAADARPCPGRKSSESATWFSILHPGLGEYYLQHWGPFWDRAPQKKFWLGFIPLYGWPGYLQVKSARDANRCRTNDNLGWSE